MQAADIGLGCLPQLEGKTLLPITAHTFFTVLGETRMTDK